MPEQLFADLATRQAIGYSFRSLCLDRSDSFRTAKAQLVRSVHDVLADIGEPIAEFTVGKTFVRKLQRIEFDADDHTTWRKEGVNRRWNDYKVKSDYDGLVVVGCVSKRPTGYQGDLTKEDYALAFEQALIHHFAFEENDERLANTSLAIGRQSEGKCAGFVIYIAFRFEEAGITSTGAATKGARIWSAASTKSALAGSAAPTKGARVRSAASTRSARAGSAAYPSHRGNHDEGGDVQEPSGTEVSCKCVNTACDQRATRCSCKQLNQPCNAGCDHGGQRCQNPNGHLRSADSEAGDPEEPPKESGISCKCLHAACGKRASRCVCKQANQPCNASCDHGGKMCQNPNGCVRPKGQREECDVEEQPQASDISCKCVNAACGPRAIRCACKQANEPCNAACDHGGQKCQNPNGHLNPADNGEDGDSEEPR